ncbi:MAG: endopeptidase La [Muribaculaceae bacterium]|nr:endopeptidase La [Muribaculaceae bacterium]
MQKKKPTIPHIESPELHLEDSIIAEIPTGSDMEDFCFDASAITVLPLKDFIAYPGMPQPIKISSDNDMEIAQKAYLAKECVFAAPLRPGMEDGKKVKDFLPAGTVCKIVKIINVPGMDPIVFLLGGPSGKMYRIVKKKPVLKAAIDLTKPLAPAKDHTLTSILVKEIKETYAKVLSYLPEQEKGRLGMSVQSIDDDAVKSVYFMANNSPLTLEERARLLKSPDLNALLEDFLRALDTAVQRLDIQAQIHMRTHENLNEQQKKHFLQQQIKTIQDELGEGDDDSDEAGLEARAIEKIWSIEAESHFFKELRKLGRFNPQSPEYAIQFSYLDNLLNLPWGRYSDDDFSLSKVEDTLNKDHYGLEQVKERILEQMAVIRLRKDMKAPIICLYGPPGVGKTSLGRSIADAVGREYARISLGGLHDEAEIRGHRRTYIGAMPGRIISALSKCGTGNPVMVLDEIDKIGKDFKGDPSTALLEVLDPEQNSKFHDNYIDFDYDLSKVMFIATANSLSDISGPLLDRMEVIEISGYIPEEKIEIARRHLVPKNLEEHGFGKDEIFFSSDALELIVNRYTRESGVRQLEKKISKVLRKVARLKASGLPFPTVIDSEKCHGFLGKEEVNPDSYESNSFAGVVTGLAWTQVGGEILFIESSLSPGNGEKLTLTGNLGDVMKESAVIALQYLKAHAGKLGIDASLFSKLNVHIHVPEGAIPKDGPSAGVTMATSLVSAFTGRKVRDKIAMTGEITLRGKVLPVGGIKEKILAAKRAGITDIIMSSDNKKDVEEINEKYLESLAFHYVGTIEEALEFALLPELAENHFDFSDI